MKNACSTKSKILTKNALMLYKKNYFLFEALYNPYAFYFDNFFLVCSIGHLQISIIISLKKFLIIFSTPIKNVLNKIKIFNTKMR